MSASWRTSCLDWEERLLSGRPLVPELPLFEDQAARALRVFNRLKLPDVHGTPSLGDATGEWFKAIVAALFGSYNVITRQRMIQEVFLLVPKKNAKAVPLDTEIATPSGFVRMRDVSIGDEVLDTQGGVTRVTSKSPVFIGHDCYEVEFSTGERVVCDAGHLWVTDAHRDRDRRRQRDDRHAYPYPTVKTTEEIAASLTVTAGRYRINNHRTNLPAPPALPEAALPIPPYALGVWLGDGASESSIVTAAHDEADQLVERLVANGQPAYVRPSSRSKTAAVVCLGIPNTVGARLVYRFRTEAVRLGVLGNKHIPRAYLRASIPQRLALLQGLMDTDGTISKTGQASITTIRPALRDGIVELVNSLGLKASVSHFIARCNGKDCGDAWNVQFWPFDFAVFTNPRKLARQRPRQSRMASRATTRQIVGVRRVPSVPVQCISVAGSDQQFLVTRSLIPTHNSTGAAGIMVTAIIINERPEAEFLLVAPTKKIADIAFGQASKMIRIDPEVAKLFLLQQHIRTITHRLTGAVLQIKAADTDVVTGGIATATLIDETHVFAKKANAAAIFLEIRGALASRPDGFLFQITTQSKTPPAGVFAAELKTARAVRDGRLNLPLLPVLYELPLRLSKDDGWQKPEYWGLVNPNLDKSVQLSFLRNSLRKAISEGPDKVALFASQHHNVEVGLALQTDRWAGAEHWEAAGTEPKLTLESLLARCEVAVVTIDGGGLDDLLGLVVEGREIGTGKRLAWCKAWVHKSVIEKAERRESVENGDDEEIDGDDEEEKPNKNGSYRPQNVQLLKDFADDGDLVIVENMGDDIKEVADIVEQVEASGILAEKYAIGVDKAGIGQIVVAIVGRGIEEQRIVSVPQGWELSGAIKTLERELVAREFAHTGSKMMAWCVGNAKAEPKGNAVAITKATAGKAKIDPLVALFMATALMTKNPESRRSIYEDAEAYRKRFGKDPNEEEGEAQPWSPEILKDPRHPDFAEHKKRFEAWQDSQPDED